MRHFLILSVLLAALAPTFAQAKRAAAPKIDPVMHEGVRYTAPNDNGRQASIQAWDPKTDKMAWKVTVFTNPIDPGLEEDVQWVFIQRISIQGGKLIIVAENGQAYSLDLKTRAVEKLKPNR